MYTFLAYLCILFNYIFTGASVQHIANQAEMQHETRTMVNYALGSCIAFIPNPKDL